MNMRLTRSTQSIFGSGQATIETYTDDEGNEWTSTGGGKPVLTQTIEQRERRLMMFALGQDLRKIFDAGLTQAQ